MGFYPHIRRSQTPSWCRCEFAPLSSFSFFSSSHSISLQPEETTLSAAKATHKKVQTKAQSWFPSAERKETRGRGMHLFYWANINGHGAGDSPEMGILGPHHKIQGGRPANALIFQTRCDEQMCCNAPSYNVISLAYVFQSGWVTSACC